MHRPPRRARARAALSLGAFLFSIASHPGSEAHAAAGPGRARVTSGLRRLGFAVRDSAAGDGRTVVVLSDVHDSTITGATLDRLAALRRTFPFDVAGFENFDHDFRNRRDPDGPQGPANVALLALLDSAAPELVTWALQTVQRRSSGGHVPILRYHAAHPVFTFGLERGDSSMLFARAAVLHQELLADLDLAWRDSSSALPDSLRRRGFAVLGDFLSRADPSCPRLPPDIDRSREGRRALQRVSFEYSGWLNRHLLDDRNRDFAESVIRELARRHVTRAVVLVGYAHTMAGGESPSVQERLHESGATVIVADAPAVQSWLEKNSAGARPRP